MKCDLDFKKRKIYTLAVDLYMQRCFEMSLFLLIYFVNCLTAALKSIFYRTTKLLDQVVTLEEISPLQSKLYYHYHLLYPKKEKRKELLRFTPPNLSIHS